MSFLIRAAIVIAVIYYVSPARDPMPGLDGAEARAAGRLWDALPTGTREQLLREGGAALAEGAGVSLRKALGDDKPPPRRSETLLAADRLPAWRGSLTQ